MLNLLIKKVELCFYFFMICDHFVAIAEQLYLGSLSVNLSDSSCPLSRGQDATTTFCCLSFEMFV